MAENDVLQYGVCVPSWIKNFEFGITISVTHKITLS